jgi:hypothetical protein
MTAIKLHLSSEELEARYESASDPIEKSHFHAVWLLSLGYAVDEVAELLSFSTLIPRATAQRAPAVCAAPSRNTESGQSARPCDHRGSRQSQPSTAAE